MKHKKQALPPSLTQRITKKIKNLGRSFYGEVKHEVSQLSAGRIAVDVLIVLVGLQVIVMGLNAMNSDRPVLGVRVEGSVVGRLGEHDFRAQTSKLIRQYEDTMLAVTAADQKSSISLRQLGVSVDKNKVYDQVLAVGHTGNIWQRFADQNLAVMGLHDIQLKNEHFNEARAKEYIAALDKQIAVAPKNAYFLYEQGKVTLRSDVPGRKVDEAKTLDVLRSADPLQTKHIQVPSTVVDAPVTAAMLRPLLPQAQAIAAKPLAIIAGNSKVTLSPEQLVGLIVVRVTPDAKDKTKQSVQLTFDEAKINAAVDEVLKPVVVSAQPTIMSGSTVVKQGTSGWRTEDDHSASRVWAALMQRQTNAAQPDEVHIPLVEVEPPVRQQVVAPGPVSFSGGGGVSLTFDDGPGGYTDQVLDVLKRYGVRATFYVIGRNVQRYPGTAQRIVSEGHKIGNHSFNHANLTGLSRAGVVDELASTQAAIREACGVTPTLFRPPYGAQNATVREVAASMGMSVNLWSVDTNDWTQPGSGVIAQRAISGARPGAVILLHSINAQTLNALPTIIEGIRARGLSFN